MKAVAYCRVSTNKEEQLDSMESQQKFFNSYAKKNGYELIGIYADEGKSGTKIKNRRQLLNLLADAKRRMFEIVLIKDISRLARNTVDFLTSIRKLKALNIKVIFVNYDQTSSDSSEFMLTMLSAIAQEESANTSKRVRFGKKQNALLGKVPNFVFGYDKIPGEYFKLTINKKEAEIVRKIYYLYTDKNMGAGKIAEVLNNDGIETKRGCKWSQTAISRILTNEIYIGKVVNGKEEVEDFLTGKRREVEEEKWMSVNNPELKILDEETYQKARNILKQRKNAFMQNGRKKSDKNIFSQLITCRYCGCSFRRLVRTYRNTKVKWVCSVRNSKGASYCENTTSIEESVLISSIQNYLMDILRENPPIMKQLSEEFKRKSSVFKSNREREEEYLKLIDKLIKEKEKYIKLFTNDIITIEELKVKVQNIEENMKDYQLKIAMNKGNVEKSKVTNRNILFEYLEPFIHRNLMINTYLKKIINRIEVDGDGNVDIYFEIFNPM